MHTYQIIPVTPVCTQMQMSWLSGLHYYFVCWSSQDQIATL